MTANGWLKFDVAEDTSLVQIYAVSGEWFMMIPKFLCPNIQVPISEDDITVFL
jgi:hypothetical protein